MSNREDYLRDRPEEPAIVAEEASEALEDKNPNPFGLELPIDHFFESIRTTSEKLIEEQKLCDPVRIASAFAHLLYAAQDRFDPEEFADITELVASAATSAMVLFANIGTMQRKIIDEVTDSMSLREGPQLILPPHLARKLPG